MRKPWLLTKSIGSTYSVTPNSFFAESEGFEPPVQRNVYTAFRVRLFRPLRQLSLFSFAKVLLFFDIDKYYAIFLQNSFPTLRLYTLRPFLHHFVEQMQGARDGLDLLYHDIAFACRFALTVLVLHQSATLHTRASIVQYLLEYS